MFYPCVVTSVSTQWLPSQMPKVLVILVSWHSILLATIASLWRIVVRIFTCGPNEAPGRNKVVWSLVGLTKPLVETKLWGLLPVGLAKPLIETKLWGLLPMSLRKLQVETKLWGLMKTKLTISWLCSLGPGWGLLHKFLVYNIDDSFKGLGFIVPSRGVIGKVQCGFLRIYAPTPYSAVFLLHALTPAPIKISFGVVRCGIGAVLQFGLDSFGSDWTNPNLLSNLHLLLDKNITF